MTLRNVSDVVRKVAALRNLCLRLPHRPTPRERRLLRRFEVLTTSPSAATAEDADAVAAGWRDWWRRGNLDAIHAMARRLPRQVIDLDRRLATMSAAAEIAATSRQSR